MIRRHESPAEYSAFFGPNNLLEYSNAAMAIGVGTWKKDHADAVFAARRQREAEWTAFANEKIVRNLNDDARAIAGVRFATASAAMLKIEQDLKRFLNNVVSIAVLEIGNETDAAGIVFVRRVVKPLGRGRSAHHAIGPFEGCGVGRVGLVGDWRKVA